MSIRKTNAALLLTPVIALAFAGAAFADDDRRAAPPAAAKASSASTGGGASFGAVVRKLESQGYTIRELDRDDRGFEADVIARDGRWLELDLDRNGRIIRTERDD